MKNIDFRIEFKTEELRRGIVEEIYKTAEEKHININNLQLPESVKKRLTYGGDATLKDLAIIAEILGVEINLRIGGE